MVFPQQLLDCIRAVENAFCYFGGIPRVIVLDNMKTAVHKADKFEMPLNGLFLQLANHYQTNVLPTRSNKPRDKSLVRMPSQKETCRITKGAVRITGTGGQHAWNHHEHCIEVATDQKHKLFVHADAVFLRPSATWRIKIKSNVV